MQLGISPTMVTDGLLDIFLTRDGILMLGVRSPDMHLLPRFAFMLDVKLHRNEKP